MGLIGKSKRSFFIGLTPYHQLYHNAVSQLEAEVAAIRLARDRAAHPQTSNSSSTGSSAAAGSGGRPVSLGLGTITEQDGHYTDSDEETPLTPANNTTTTRAAAATTAPPGVPVRSTSPLPVNNSRRPGSTGRHSPKTGPSRTPSRNLTGTLNRPASTFIGDFNNIYGEDEVSEGEDEYVAYEDAPVRPINKVDRNDQKNKSFYKHKQQPQSAAQGLAGVQSPLVTMEVYPRPGVNKEISGSGSRQQSLR